ncbi:helix-turn-helix domain-containing protein [Flavobacterium rivuli]|uniref:helix-turn-helix domain-containing protein n=1 Tax=Flavobacterium rivuli TaxID=498301 RepID=UPI001E2846AB|nr:helix-turn-helix domain-containing protein [Flavobacterium rivuli]
MGEHRLKTIEENERAHIITALRQCGGRIRGINGAAEILGVPPTTLASKMQKLGIKR